MHLSDYESFQNILVRPLLFMCIFMYKQYTSQVGLSANNGQQIYIEQVYSLFYDVLHFTWISRFT